MRTIPDLLREAFVLKHEITPVEIADHLVKLGRDDGYRVTRGGTDDFPELTFEDKHGRKGGIVLDPSDGRWKRAL